MKIVVTSGSPITTSGTIAVGLQTGYSIPTTVKQSNWDDAYTFVSSFPTQTGNSGKYLTTDGSSLSWGTVSTTNIYNSDGTLTGNRTVTSGGYFLRFTGNNSASSGVARGLHYYYTLTATANNDILAALDIESSFVGGFTGTSNWGIRIQSGQGLLIGTTPITGTSSQLQFISNDATMAFKNIGSANYAGLNVYDDTNTLVGSLQAGGTTSGSPFQNNFFIGARRSTGRLIFVRGTSATQSATFFSTGNLLIQDGGTHTDAGYKLDVQGTGRFTDSITNTNAYLQVPNSNGLQIGFWSGTNPLTKSNIAITNSGTGGAGTAQAFPVMTGKKNIFIVGTDNPAGVGSPTMSGDSNIVLGNLSISNPISGSQNVLLNSRGSISSGNGNTGLGYNALNGITTGSNNLHLTIGAGYGNGSFTSSLSNSVYIGDPVKSNNNTTVAGDIVITTPYTATTQFWWGGKSDASDIYFNIPVNTGTNQTGWDSYWRSGIGTGTGEPGKIYFQHSTPTTSGTTIQSSFTNTLTLERKIGRAHV